MYDDVPEAKQRVLAGRWKENIQSIVNVTCQQGMPKLLAALVQLITHLLLCFRMVRDRLNSVCYMSTFVYILKVCVRQCCLEYAAWRIDLLRQFMHEIFSPVVHL